MAAAAVLLAACGGSGDTTPTSEELAARLLTAEDLGEGWTVEYSGPLTDEMRADAGAIDMCDEARSIVAPISEGLESTGDWQADWQRAVHALDLQMAALTLPVDRADAQPVSLVEAVVADDSGQVQTVYTALSDGYRRCLSVPPPAGEEHAGATELVLPEVGDERFGFVLRMGTEDRWDIRWAIVRDGDVLLVVEENEIFSEDGLLTDQEFADIVATAAEKLP